MCIHAIWAWDKNILYKIDQTNDANKVAQGATDAKFFALSYVYRVCAVSETVDDGGAL